MKNSTKIWILIDILMTTIVLIQTLTIINLLK
jgi:hypothetical protein